MISTEPSAELSDDLPVGCVQRVPPAGALRETRWVLLAMALTLFFGALTVVWQRHAQSQARLLAHQIDLATGLDAAEQGIYTDLQAVYDEWRSLGAPLPPPTPQRWADDGWPPFVNDLAAQRRGRRHWRLLSAGGRHAYLGVGERAASRALLWRLPGEHAKNMASVMAQSDEAGEAGFDLWLHMADTGDAPPGQAVAPESLSTLNALDDASLIRQGWCQAAARLHARKHAPDAHGARVAPGAPTGH